VCGEREHGDEAEGEPVPALHDGGAVVALGVSLARVLSIRRRQEYERTYAVVALACYAFIAFEVVGELMLSTCEDDTWSCQLLPLGGSRCLNLHIMDCYLL
jgi:hypothetical protein